MRRFRIPSPLALSLLPILPCLLLLSSCGGEPPDEPAEATAAEAEAPLSEVPAAQAAYDGAQAILARDRAGAIALFKEAAELDPGFLEAITMASYQLAWHYQNTDRSASVREDALRFAQAAQELAPDHEWTLAALGANHYRIEHDYDRAMETYQRGTELYPENAHFRRMSAHVARRQGDWDRALQILTAEEEIAPSNDALQAIIENHWYNRRWDEMMDAAREHVRRNPESTFGPDYLAWGEYAMTASTQPIRDFYATLPATEMTEGRWTLEMMDADYAAALAVMDASSTEVFWGQYGMAPRDYYRGVSLQALGRGAEGREALLHAKALVEEMLPELDHDCRLHGALGLIDATLGNRDEAVREAERGVELVPPERDALIGPYNVLNLAEVYSILGEAEPAVEQLGLLLSIPSDVNQASLEVRGVWDNIREHPAFQALMTG